MTVVLLPECDGCHVSGQQLDSATATPEEAAAGAGLVSGAEFDLTHLHPQCLADLRLGIDPATGYGLPGLCSEDAGRTRAALKTADDWGL